MLGGVRGLNRWGRAWVRFNHQQRASSSLLVGRFDCQKSQVPLCGATPSSLLSLPFSFVVKTPQSSVRFRGTQVDSRAGDQVKWEETGVYSTPAMVQYSQIKAKYPEHLVLFQMGEFYEMFGEDAEWARRTLGLAASTRRSTGILMTGVPIHLLEEYATKILIQGKTICICNQRGRPKKGEIIPREVTRIISPGTSIDSAYLQPRKQNYLCSIFPNKSSNGEFSLCWLDMSTGETSYTSSLEKNLESLLLRIQPSEILVEEGLSDRLSPLLERYCVTVVPSEVGEGEGSQGQMEKVRDWFLKTAERKDFEGLVQKRSREELFNFVLGKEGEEGVEREEMVGVEGEGEGQQKEEIQFPEMTETEAGAIGTVLNYIEYCMPSKGNFSLKIPERDAEAVMRLDLCTKECLEFTKCNAPDTQSTFYEDEGLGGATGGRHRKYRTLLSALDATVTAVGGRRMAKDLASPLTSVLEINRRLDAVEYFMGREGKGGAEVVGEVRGLLRQTSDLERCIQRVSLGRGTSRDILAIGVTLKKLGEIKELLLTEGGEEEGHPDSLISSLLSQIDPLSSLAELIVQAIAPEPPLQPSLPGHIEEGFSPDLDRLRNLSKRGEESISDLLASLKESTGISGLKILRNNMFGFFLEVPKQSVGNVPSEWRHIQTYPKSMRYRNLELQERETEVNDAASSSLDLERAILSRFRQLLVLSLPSLRETAAAVARLDVLTASARIAEERGYVRPVVDDSLDLVIERGRHPVVELFQEPDVDFIPNDCQLSQENERMWILTGPNMAGKSTFLRQTAIIIIMAQMGGFVPANRALIGVTDALFSRVGSSADNLQANQSTFMMEMRETAAILGGATGRSVVMMDEIGRGTSPADGGAIAAAVTRFLHDQTQCRGLFATHFHELPDFARENLPNASPYCVAIEHTGGEEGQREGEGEGEGEEGELVFTFEVRKGDSPKSYGIHCARLAGLPEGVIQDATRMLADQEAGEGRKTALEKEVQNLDLEKVTPEEALSLLSKWKKNL